MKVQFAALILSLTFFGYAGASARADELAYKFKSGDATRYEYNDDTVIKLSLGDLGGGLGGLFGGMGGMAGAGASSSLPRVQTRTIFTQKIGRVSANGSAEVTFVIESMELTIDGKRLPKLPPLPPEAREATGEIDAKGHVTFYKLVTVYEIDNTLYLGLALNNNGISMSASGGGTQVQLFASVDPKTGKVEMAASFRQVPPTLKAVQVKESDPTIDVLPKALATLFELPQGDVQVGQRQSLSAGMAGIATTGEIVILGQQGAIYDFELNVEMSQDSSGMGDMGMGNEMQLKNDVKGKLTTKFDNAQGKLLLLVGKIDSSFSMGGFGMESHTVASLKKI